MDHIERYLARYRTIDLEQMNTIKLMKRYDRKFTFHKDKLTKVFDDLCERYQVLEIDHDRIFKYENLYYDTADRLFYRQHHNRRVNRYKLRRRKYVDTDQCFFEIKFKTNKDKTIKTRMLLKNENMNDALSQESKAFARRAVLIDENDFVENINPSLWISFNRVTLADLVHRERITFDMNLTYTDKRFNSRKISNLIIAELKSEKVSMSSPFPQYLKDIQIFPSGFSKYCMGIAMMEDDIKYNRFKKKLLKLQNLM